METNKVIRESFTSPENLSQAQVSANASFSICAYLSSVEVKDLEMYATG